MIKNTLAMLFIFFILGVTTGIIGTYCISKQDSPYLKKPERLNDVITALFVLGTWKIDKEKPERWQEIIGAPPKSATSWSRIFEKHSEFFRTDSTKVSLVWRNALNKPLTPEETTALIEIANNMQTQAIARSAEQRWWIPVFFGLLGVIIGALIKTK